VLSEKDLDDSARQLFFISQEAADTAGEGITRNSTGDFDANISGVNRRIQNVADPVDLQDVATKNFIQTQTAADLALVTTARQTAEQHKDDAETARDESVTAKNQSVSAKDDAETAKAQADAAVLVAQAAASATNGYLAGANIPQSLTGRTGYFLQVNALETGYNLVASVASPKFFGFKNTADGQIELTFGDINVDVADYDTFDTAENVSFILDNNNLTMLY
jgi:hypothetical protein